MGKRVPETQRPPRNLVELAARSGEMVDCQTAGRYLGVSHKTVRRRIADGTIPGYRIGRSIRVRVADLELLRVPVVGA